MFGNDIGEVKLFFEESCGHCHISRKGSWTAEVSLGFIFSLNILLKL